MIEMNNQERKIIKALNSLGKKTYTSKIANEAKLSSGTASKYLMALKIKGLVTKDSSQPPHIYWELTDSKEIEEILQS
ncbi:MAG: winged helix-turn-helix domain-containing protein [Methanosarcinales archaeon]|nr:winged helix-turn-helix domain-containing protein [Methanosarcinales archaeon]